MSSGRWRSRRPDCATRFLAFYSDVDQLTLPQRFGRLEHPDLDVTNVLVHGVGHMSLPIHGRIVHQICTALATQRPEGTRITEARPIRRDARPTGG